MDIILQKNSPKSYTKHASLRPMMMMMQRQTWQQEQRRWKINATWMT